VPTKSLPPKSCSAYAVCSASTMPMNAEVMTTMEIERTPIWSN
jgi:hypothetical protein